MPGEASSVVTCIDGYQMARQGRAGAALAVAALGSFFAGCVGTVFIALADASGTVVERRSNAYERALFKELTAQQALEMLRRRLISA
jgi:nicotinamide mononucleotide (NMN) deamidase PncC